MPLRKPKAEWIQIRVDRETKDVLARHAKQRGVTMSELLLGCWLRAMRRDQRAWR